MAFDLLDIIFPPRCVHCHVYLGRGQALCAACRRRIVLHRTFFCGKCRARRYAAQGLCHRGFPFRLAAAGEYEDPILKELVRALKFHFLRDAAAMLGLVLAVYATRLKMHRGYDLILPVPLGRQRQRERGFNQAELIARSFAPRVGLPVETAALRRTRNTIPQSSLRRIESRPGNVAGCFQVCAPHKVAGRNIILLDDVITSGATLLEAAHVLQTAGAEDILALVAVKA